MNRFPIVSTLLLVPPVGMWISELTFDARRVDVSAVLSIVSQWLGEGWGRLGLPFLGLQLRSLSHSISISSDVIV